MNSNSSTHQLINSLTTPAHQPVLLNEVIALLDPKPGEFFIDGTSGGNGHTAVIREKLTPGGKLLSIDWEKTGENYADLPDLLVNNQLGLVDGLLLDLGFSSEQLGGQRGFSFMKDEPLLMTYNPERRPAKEIIKKLNEEDLTNIIKVYGEERYAGRIAKAIKTAGKNKPIETTSELAAIIKKAVPASYERGRIHPATRTFMDLRIYVNQELENLETALKSLGKILKPGGRVAIISFHSLEDRLVKNYFRDYAKAGYMEIITRKPVTSTAEATTHNPRSRSAKLRAAVWLGSSAKS